MKNLLRKINKALSLPFIGIVWTYQIALSPDHSWLKAHYPQGYCRFYPSCSAYALDGLKKDGLLSIPRIFWRVMRCQPWSLGGIDNYEHSLTHKH